jgi:hypothetical protein
MYNYM